MSQSRLLILGAGRFAADVADWAAEIDGVEPIGFFQDAVPNPSDSLDGLPILAERDLPRALASAEVVCAIGSSQRMDLIERIAALGARFRVLAHPSARISRLATVGPGTILAPFSNVAAHSELDSHVILNRSASIGHDVRVGRYATIGPGAIVAGAAVVGRSVLIGAGAVIRDRVQVGDQATIGAGSVAVRDVAPEATIVGIPARAVPAG